MSKIAYFSSNWSSMLILLWQNSNLTVFQVHILNTTINAHFPKGSSVMTAWSKGSLMQVTFMSAEQNCEQTYLEKRLCEVTLQKNWIRPYHKNLRFLENFFFSPFWHFGQANIQKFHFKFYVLCWFSFLLLHV